MERRSAVFGEVGIEMPNRSEVHGTDTVLPAW